MNISEACMKLTTFSVSNAEKMEGGVRFRMAGRHSFGLIPIVCPISALIPFLISTTCWPLCMPSPQKIR